MKSVAVIGGVTLDRIVHMDRLPESRPHTVFASSCFDMVGSTGAGKALNLCRLGFDVFLHAQIGADPAGKTIETFFAAQELTTSFHIDPKGTATHINLMDSAGGRVSIFTSYTSFEPEIELHPLEETIAARDYLVLNIMNYARRLIPFAKRVGKKIWCDLHDYDGTSEYYRDFLDAADYLFVSADRLQEPERFMADQLRRGKELVVCTFGKQGAKALAKSGESSAIGIVDDYVPVDTNGAGDAFFSGFLYGHSQQWSLHDCMKMGAIVGGLCVSSRELFHPELSEAHALAEFSTRVVSPMAE